MSDWSAPVSEYMSKGLISVRSSTPLSEVQALFSERDISALPVLDDFGGLCGILSTTDLLRIARLELKKPGLVERITTPAKTAGDIMVTDVVTVDESAPVREAATLMNKFRIHRLVVLRQGAPVAVITTRDAMVAVFFQRVQVPLSRVMTTPVESIELTEPIATAVARLDDANVHGLVVVDGEWPVGVFTHTEAIKARALPTAQLAVPVEQAMSYETICMDVATPLYRVAGYARHMNVRRVLAVEGRRLRGIATGFDLVRLMATDAG